MENKRKTRIRKHESRKAYTTAQAILKAFADFSRLEGYISYSLGPMQGGKSGQRPPHKVNTLKGNTMLDELQYDPFLEKGYTYTKKFVVFLKFTFNQHPVFLLAKSGNPSPQVR